MVSVGSKQRKGFTLIEVIVAVSIIAILSMIVLSVVFNARMEARDTMRIAVAEQLKLGIRLYKSAHGDYPSYPQGVEIGSGSEADGELLSFVTGFKPDPLGSGSDGEYGYWFFSDVSCNGDSKEIIIVRSFEVEGNGNYGEVCGGALDLPFEADNAYIILIN